MARHGGQRLKEHNLRLSVTPKADAKRLRRWSARRLKRDFELPWSEKAIRRVCGDHGLNRKYRRRKHQTKRYLREVKKAWRVFQQVDADTKDLNDIPEYWLQMLTAYLATSTPPATSQRDCYSWAMPTS